MKLTWATMSQAQRDRQNEYSLKYRSTLSDERKEKVKLLGKLRKRRQRAASNPTDEDRGKRMRRWHAWRKNMPPDVSQRFLDGKRKHNRNSWARRKYGLSGPVLMEMKRDLVQLERMIKNV